MKRVHSIAEAISGVALFDEFQGHGFGNRFAQGGFVQETWQYFEWRMGEGHEQITDDDLLNAWTVFLEQLQIDIDRREAEEKEGNEVGKFKSAPDMSHVGSLEGAPDWWTAPREETPHYIKIEKEREIRRVCFSLPPLFLSFSRSPLTQSLALGSPFPSHRTFFFACCQRYTASVINSLSTHSFSTASKKKTSLLLLLLLLLPLPLHIHIIFMFFTLMLVVCV